MLKQCFLTKKIMINYISILGVIVQHFAYQFDNPGEKSGSLPINWVIEFVYNYLSIDGNVSFPFWLLTWLTWLKASVVLELQWSSKVTYHSWLSPLLSSPIQYPFSECPVMWAVVCLVSFYRVLEPIGLSMIQALSCFFSSGQQSDSSSLWFLRDYDCRNVIMTSLLQSRDFAVCKLSRMIKYGEIIFFSRKTDTHRNHLSFWNILT